MSERSKGGSPILRHEPREGPITYSHGDAEVIETVERHIDRFLGPVAHVFHEIVSSDVHLDVHVVAPSEARPFWTLVTSGMSEKPMTVPPGAEDFAFAELMITLPATWRLSQQDFADERWYWPVRWLKTLARLPHEYGTWLGFGHTVPNGDPPSPYAPGTDFCCMLVLPPVSLPEGFHTAHTPSGRAISFSTRCTRSTARRRISSSRPAPTSSSRGSRPLGSSTTCGRGERTSQRGRSSSACSEGLAHIGAYPLPRLPIDR